MTTIDHQQAALLAAAKAIAPDGVFASDFAEYSRKRDNYQKKYQIAEQTYALEEADKALAAATPHLRAAWEQELREAVKRLPWNGVTHGGTMVPLDAVLALLEGSAE